MLHVCVQTCVCVSLSVCLWNIEHVRWRCCCSRLSCYLQLRVYRPPQVGRGYPMLTCLIVCLSQGPPVSVCVTAVQRRTRATVYTHMHAHTDAHRGRSIKTRRRSHRVSVRDCWARAVSVCPIKMCLYQGAYFKSACCFQHDESSAHIMHAHTDTHRYRKLQHHTTRPWH